MLLAVRISSYGCTWEVWRALKKLELLSAAPRATLTHLSCSPHFPRASITRYTLPWVPEVFFSRAMGSFVSSATGRQEFGRRPQTRAAKWRSGFRAGHFLRRPKSVTAHEKPLAPRVEIIYTR